MRAVSEALQARLDTGTTFMCRCWLLKRSDGVTFGFTDHDRDLSFDGNVFKAGSGLDTSVIEASTGLSVDNGQVVGALSDAVLSEVDIMGGKYDGAEVWQWQVDWQQPDLRILLFRGTLGEIRRGTNAFEVELRGITEVLNQPLGRTYLRTCDRVFGDSKCRADVGDPAFSREVTVVGTHAARQFTFEDLESFAPEWFTQGSIKWVSGAMAGEVSLIKSDVLSGDQRVLEAAEDARMAVVVGDRALVVAGCDKRHETCRVKFGNFRNFHGFPHMPSEDWVLSYPSRGEVNDGGRLREFLGG